MKLILVTLLSFIQFSATAGVIKMRSSDQVIELKFTQETNNIEIKSNSGLIQNQAIMFYGINRKKSEIDLWSQIKKSRQNTFHTRNVGGTLGEIVAAVPLAWAALKDGFVYPYKGMKKLIENKKFKKDIAKIQEAIGSNGDVIVTKKRFERIAALLSEVAKMQARDRKEVSDIEREVGVETDYRRSQVRGEVLSARAVMD